MSTGYPESTKHDELTRTCHPCTMTLELSHSSAYKARPWERRTRQRRRISSV